MYKIRWMNKESGHIGIGDVLTKEVDFKGGTTFRMPLDLGEAEELCKYANRNYRRARHVVVEVCSENNKQ